MFSYIINATKELCRCGHFGGKSTWQTNAHRDTFQRGHGGCDDCDCQKFTWVEIKD